MGLGIIMLQHEVMVLDEWHNNGPRDLVTVSLCFQNAINKIHMCLLSIKYACPYHNPRHHGPHESHEIISRAWQGVSQATGYGADHLLSLRVADGGGEAPWNVLFCHYKFVLFNKVLQHVNPFLVYLL